MFSTVKGKLLSIKEAKDKAKKDERMFVAAISDLIKDLPPERITVTRPDDMTRIISFEISDIRRLTIKQQTLYAGGPIPVPYYLITGEYADKYSVSQMGRRSCIRLLEALPSERLKNNSK
jgi:hypothetical protein